jgi:hypothetical protein
MPVPFAKSRCNVPVEPLDTVPTLLTTTFQVGQGADPLEQAGVPTVAVPDKLEVTRVKLEAVTPLTGSLKV